MFWLLLHEKIQDINNKDECRGIRMVQRFAVEEICYKCLLIFILEYDQSNRSFVKMFRYSFLETSPMFFNRLKTVRNIPKFKDRAKWSRDTFQPMRRRACVYQQTNQNIAPVIKNFQNNGRSRTESVIVSRFSGIFLRLFMRHTKFF